MSGIGHNRPPVFTGEAGWVRIDRAIRTHWLVGFGQPVPPADPDQGSYSRSEAFIDLIMECRYEAGTVNNGGRKMTIEPGQLVGAISWLARRWNWTPMTVRTFLDKLEADGMIERNKPGVQQAPDADRNMQVGKQATIITVCNFLEYQVTDAVRQLAKQQADNMHDGKQATSRQHASNNNTKDNKGTREQEEDTLSDRDRTQVSRSKKPRTKAPPSYSESFEQFWQAYPDRTNNSKPAAAIEFERLDADGRALAVGSLAKFASYCRANPDYRCIHAERYLRDRRFDSFASAPKTDHWSKDPARVAAISDAQWRGSIAKYANGIWPIDKLGPPPGSPKCVVPRHIVDELRLVEKYDANGISKGKH